MSGGPLRARSVRDLTSHRRLLSCLPEQRGAEVASLAAWFAEHGQHSWNRLHESVAAIRR